MPERRGRWILEAMFKSGDLVAEHLRLVRLLGAGGMGSVWVAEHLRLRTEVAVKFLSATMLNNTAARTRFDREAQLVAQVKSPHVVQVLDQGFSSTDPPQPYIVMELLEGQDLGRLLERRGTLPLDELVYLVDQICAGLGAAHHVGLVHRDIKPENIFLMEGERPFVKILDFGIARATQDTEVQRLTHTGGVIGTAHYMSPEQLFEGKQVDHRTDIWALGVVVYRALTGRLPFDGLTYGDLCLAVNQGVFTPPSQVVPLSPELDGFMARALASDRNTRFASAKEFSTELTQLCYRTSSASGLPMAPLHLGTGSSPGVVSATTTDQNVTGSGTGGSVGERIPSGTLQTGANSTVTVEAVPVNRSGLVATIGIAAILVLAGGAFAASQLWSRNQALEPGAKPPASATARVEATPSASSSTTLSVEPALSSSAPSAALTADASAEPSGTETSRAPAPSKPPRAAPKTKAVAPRAPRTSRPSPEASKTPSPQPQQTHELPSSQGTKATAPAAKEKYRGF